MSVDIENISERNTLPPPPIIETEVKAEKEIGAGEKSDQRDKTIRHFKAVQLGLSPDSTWDDINRYLAEQTRISTAVKLGMDANTEWGKITTEFRRKWSIICGVRKRRRKRF